MSRKLLVVVDMQNDFIDGSLGTKEAQAILPGVADKIKAYLNEDNTSVICTLDTHYENYLSTQEGKKLPVVHCIKGTHGHLLHSDIRKAFGGVPLMFEKETFGSLELAEYIKVMSDLEEIELIGLCTDICVVSNALLVKAYMPEVKISVDASCCAGVTPESNKSALETMKMCQVNVFNEHL